MGKSYNQGVADANRRRATHNSATQGTAHNRLYNKWRSIKQRCTDPNSAAYHRYGGRGITMHPEWAEDFAAVLRDVGDAPEGKTLDRIDNDGGYVPGNLRWATRKEQANNRATNVVLTWEGETRTLMEWAEHLGCKYGLLASRWKKGLREADLFAPPQWERDRMISFRGESKPLTQWASETGISYTTLRWRHNNGKDLF